MSRRSQEFFEEFNKHVVSDSNQNYILLTDQALYMLSGIFEEYPFLKQAIDFSNKYRVHISKFEFDLFFVPAIRVKYDQVYNIDELYIYAD